MDQPSAVFALLAGLAAGVIATAQPVTPDHADPASIVPGTSPAAAVDSARSGCLRRSPDRNIAPSTVSPGRPPDAQINADGINRAGGVGGLPTDTRGDPCASVVRPGQRARSLDLPPAGAISASAPSGVTR